MKEKIAGNTIRFGGMVADTVVLCVRVVATVIQATSTAAAMYL